MDLEDINAVFASLGTLIEKELLNCGLINLLGI